MYSAKVLIIIQKRGGKMRVFSFIYTNLYGDDCGEYWDDGEWGRSGFQATNVGRKLCAVSFEKG